MSGSAYTLLIVESPVLAKVIQQNAPSFVYVIATGGYCWHPVYKKGKNKLTTRADPQKLSLRKELKEQAKWAGNIIIATDADPSGDFIAWSVSRFLKSTGIKRGYLKSIGKNGVLEMLRNTTILDESTLEYRLRNRFLIREEWLGSALPLHMREAGLVSIFGYSKSFQTFEDEHGNLFKSTRPVSCNTGEWIPIQPAADPAETFYLYKPLSTFDVISEFKKDSHIISFSEIQNHLQQLFQSVLPSSQESLISYPRTKENAFHSETWKTLSNQFLKFGSLNNLKPPFLQQVARPDAAHESVHPLDLQLQPEMIRSELPHDIFNLYQLIYQKTVEAIKIPVFPDSVYSCDFYPDIRFYPAETGLKTSAESLRPLLTIADLGHALNHLGVQTPSSFGKNVDYWKEKKWVSIQTNFAEAGEAMYPYLPSAGKYNQKLTTLKQLSADPDLDPETVKSVITS